MGQRARHDQKQDQPSPFHNFCVIAVSLKSIWLADLYDWHALLQQAVHAVLSPVRDPVRPLPHLYEHRESRRRPPLEDALLRPSLPRFIITCRQIGVVCWRLQDFRLPS